MRLWFLYLVVVLLPLFASAETESDQYLNSLVPQGMVNDFAGILSPEEKSACQHIVSEIKRATSAELAVVTVPSMKGGEINDFTEKIYQKWGIGEKDKNNGILFLTAVQERKMRIEVGYGFEDVLPDARTGRLLDEQVLPHYRIQQFGVGLLSGTRALAAIIAQSAGVTLTNVPGLETNFVPEAAVISAVSTNQVAGSTPPPSLFTTFFFLFIIVLFAVLVVVAIIKGKKSGGGGLSSGSGGSSGGNSSSGDSFGGGSSGGGGASRGW